MGNSGEDAAKLHAPHHEVDPSAMSPVKPRLSETGGRKSCGSGKEGKEKGQRHEWVKREQKIPNSGKIHHFRRKHSFFFLFSFFTFVLKFRMKASCFATNFSHAIVVR